MPSPPATVQTTIDARDRDLGGGFMVRRVLPHSTRRRVGPFTFVDHFGPVRLPPGQGLDVRPHPHINLATVTYLFDGQIRHQDSLGSDQILAPGAVNWMTAGRGIVHSERSPASARAAGPSAHGLQLWVALPIAREEMDPTFQHHVAATIPETTRAGVQVRVLAGAAFGVEAPVRTESPLFFVEARLPPAASLSVEPSDLNPPGVDPTLTERAAYVISGAVTCDGITHGPGRMLVFTAGTAVALGAAAPEGAHVALLGGAPLDGERHIWWNFVSSSRDRIERAKEDWRAGRFPKIPGDQTEFIPLPDGS